MLQSMGLQRVRQDGVTDLREIRADDPGEILGESKKKLRNSYSPQMPVS